MTSLGKTIPPLSGTQVLDDDDTPAAVVEGLNVIHPELRTIV